MPLYEYQCNDCNSRFDAFRSIQDANAPIRCKKCLSLNTRKALSLFSASSDGRSVTNAGGCAGCSGGTCSSCGH